MSTLPDTSATLKRFLPLLGLLACSPKEAPVDSGQGNDSEHSEETDAGPDTEDSSDSGEHSEDSVEDTETGLEKALGLSLLRIESHAHPYTRDESGEIVYDKGEALLGGILDNNLGVALCSASLGDELSNGLAVESIAMARPEVVPLLWVHPSISEDTSTAELFLRDHAFAGLKFHPSNEMLAADDPRMDPYLELAARYDLPVVIHTASDDPSLPSRVGRLAARHPEVSVVLYHSGLGMDHLEAVDVLHSCDNCTLELSWVSWPDAQAILSTEDTSRLLFGTDIAVDGPDHYENDWSSGAGDGSWDAWLVAAGNTLGREDYRALVVENSARLFHLVTVHACAEGGDSPEFFADVGHGFTGPWTMSDEGDGWWRKSVAAPVGLRFRLGDAPEQETLDPEIWTCEGEILPAPEPTTIRATFDVGYGHALYLRGSGWPLSWGAGEPMQWSEGDTWSLTLPGVHGALEVKVLIDDQQWEDGENHRVEAGGELSFVPVLSP